MVYSIDLRTRVVQFIEEGGSVFEASRVFKVTRQTVYNWINKKQRTGSLKDKPQGRPWRKLNRKELIIFVNCNSDLTLSEFAKHFKTGVSTICEAFKRLGISRKKRVYATKSEMKKKGQYFWKS